MFHRDNKWKHLIFASAGLLSVSAQAGILFNYPNFSNTAGLTFVGNTATANTVDGTVLRVTPALNNQSGAAYSTAAVSLGANATFSTIFQFRFTNAGGINPADGITFVLAQNPAGLGVAGGGIGYQGVPNSVAIEFDTFQNGGNDTSSNHAAIDTGGVLTNSNLINLYGIGICTTATHLQPGCMSNGDVWSVTISYDGANLSGTAWDTTGEAAPFTLFNNLPINISAALGTNTAFVGFTSGTGAGHENHDILNWQFANSAQLGMLCPNRQVSRLRLPVSLG